MILESHGHASFVVKKSYPHCHQYFSNLLDYFTLKSLSSPITQLRSISPPSSKKESKCQRPSYVSSWTSTDCKGAANHWKMSPHITAWGSGAIPWYWVKRPCLWPGASVLLVREELFVSWQLVFSAHPITVFISLVGICLWVKQRLCASVLCYTVVVVQWLLCVLMSHFLGRCRSVVGSSEATLLKWFQNSSAVSHACCGGD